MEPSPEKKNTKSCQYSPHAAVHLASELPIIQAKSEYNKITISGNSFGEGMK